jgi:hypothetical protein
MENLQNRHDLFDKQWLKIEPIITAKIGNRQLPIGEEATQMTIDCL